MDEFHIYLDINKVFKKLEYGFLHKEQKGIVAIDQSGSKNKLEETRMYVYPCNENKILLLLMINRKGNKKEQNKNINECIKLLKKWDTKNEKI